MVSGLALLIGAGTAIALVRARNKEKTRSRRIMRAYRVITECNQLLTRCREEQTLATEICNLLVGSGNYSLAWVGYAERDNRKSVRPFASAGNVRGYLQTIRLAWSNDTYGRGPVGVAIREGRSTAVQNIAESGEEIPWREAARACGYRSLMSVPLRVGEEDVGALTIYSSDPDAFDSHEKELLQGLAEDLSYGIEALRSAEERRRVERQLKTNQDRLKRAEELGRFGSWEYDLRTGHLHWSDELYRILGYQPGEVTPERDRSLSHVPEDVQSRVRELLDKALREQRSFTLEHPIIRKDGSQVHVLSRADVIPDVDGQAERIIGALHDISERKWWEEALKKTLDEREALLRELLHRSKNTLQVIASMLHLRRSSLEDSPLRTLMLELESKIHSMALVHEKLYESDSFSQLELHEYLQELGNMLCNTLLGDRSDIACRFELEPFEGSIDTAVPIGLILNELFTNAVNHAFPGEQGGEITIRLEREDDQTGRITVRDNGEGLPEGFDPERSGGLGLQTVQILAQSQLRGSVQYSSEGGTLCVVRFTA
jgi:PAS domain S-box-containing protein